MYTQTAEQINHGRDRQQKIRRYDNEAKILLFPVPAEKHCDDTTSASVRVMPVTLAEKHAEGRRSRLMRKRRKRAQEIIACFIIAAMMSLTFVFTGVLLLGVSLSMENAAELFSIYALVQTLIWGILLVRS